MLLWQLARRAFSRARAKTGKDSGQYSDDGDDHKKLNQCKTLAHRPTLVAATAFV
jgi:hypothetical protein